MIIVGVTFSGNFHCQVIERGGIIDGDRYLDFLKTLNHNFSRHINPLYWNQMFLLHDNARPHVKATVHQYLEDKGVTLVKQPPWSPDFNLLDRFVFKHLENSRKHLNFVDENEIKKFLTNLLRNITSDEWTWQFENWKSDLHKVIENGGDYL